MDEHPDQDKAPRGNADPPSSEDDRSAGVSPAVSGASRPRFDDIDIRTGGRLPHWTADHAVYFVTFRLYGSLPANLLHEVREERARLAQEIQRRDSRATRQDLKRLARLSTRVFERALDEGGGPCFLKHPDVAELVAGALRRYDRDRYILYAWCIMPNHVHVVVAPLRSIPLERITHTWKSYTAKAANHLLRRTGAFWQKESYDHILRTDEELTRAVAYVVGNPGKARLEGWRWVWPSPE